MMFQDDISNMNTYVHTYIRTSRNEYVPYFFKVGGIITALLIHDNGSIISIYKLTLIFANSELHDQMK